MYIYTVVYNIHIVYSMQYVRVRWWRIGGFLPCYQWSAHLLPKFQHGGWMPCSQGQPAQPKDRDKNARIWVKAWFPERIQALNMWKLNNLYSGYGVGKSWQTIRSGSLSLRTKRSFLVHLQSRLAMQCEVFGYVGVNFTSDSPEILSAGRKLCLRSGPSARNMISEFPSSGFSSENQMSSEYPKYHWILMDPFSVQDENLCLRYWKSTTACSIDSYDYLCLLTGQISLQLLDSVA